ncbi:MAG TPA: FtsW/RodA/SpoVE family cell cycle protein [Rhizomicrobium sp.]|jgi:cell division protein FtsW|nr:FtsW/RodA/SpoVE family cell cycle protein [Rhizomicrobium sp.]
MTLSRDRSGRFADWWWTIDRVALFAMFGLIAIGLMLAFAASPAATAHNAVQAGNFHFAAKQIVFAAVAAVIVAGGSLLNTRDLKRAAAIVFVIALGGSVLVLLTGEEVLGARRWIDLGWLTVQPSEFLKPSFAVLCAAVLAGKAGGRVRKELVSLGLVLTPLVLLVLEPDVGQTGLLLALWGAMLFLDGISVVWVGMITGIGTTLCGMAYLLIPHVHHRVDQFFGGGKPGYQSGLAMKAFEHGGLVGVGPGAGTIKYHLPYAHSDFIFAVAGEEFGLVLCGIIAVLFCLLSVRLLLRAAAARDKFSQLAGASLALIVALQAFINMGVAVNLLPAKGMTLPFISYGGSSLFAVAVTMGFALAITRQRPAVTRLSERDTALLFGMGEARA